MVDRHRRQFGPSEDSFMADLLSQVDGTEGRASSSSSGSTRFGGAPATSFASRSRPNNTAAAAAAASASGTHDTARSTLPVSPDSASNGEAKMSLAEIQRMAFTKPSKQPSSQISQQLPQRDPAMAHPPSSAFSRGLPQKQASQRPASQASRAFSRSRSDLPSRQTAASYRSSAAVPVASTSRAAGLDASWGDNDDWMADLDEAVLTANAALPSSGRNTVASVKEEDYEDVKPVEGVSGSSSTSTSNQTAAGLIKRASRTQSKLWADRAKEAKTANRIHRSYIRCRVLSVRESTYEHQLPNSARTVERPQKTVFCIERPRRGAQNRDDELIEGELPLATWDGRSQAKTRRLILREEWTVTRIEVGDYVHCVGHWDEEPMDVDDELEFRQCTQREEEERLARSAKTREKSNPAPDTAASSVVKQEDSQELPRSPTPQLPPSSFDSDGGLFADLDEDQLMAPQSDAPRPCILTMHLLSSSPVAKTPHADNLLILHPDTLVTATAVCDVPTCVRKPLIKQRINGTGAVDKMSEAVVMGNMLHEVLQACLTGNGVEADEDTAALVPDFDSQDSLTPYLDMPFPMVWYGPGRTNFSLPFLLRQAKLQVLHNLEGLLCCSMDTQTGEEKLLERCRPFGEFAQRYLEDSLAANRAGHVGEQVHGLFRGLNGMMNMAGIFKEDAVVLDSRAAVPTLARVTHVFDVEEEIWSPMYGLKGKMDVSVEVEMQETHTEVPAWRGGNHYVPGNERGDVPRQQQSFYRRAQSNPNPNPKQYQMRSSSIMPMEIKTGRSVDALEHRAQTMLYSLIMSDRYGTDVNSGLLYYTRSGDMHRVRRTRNEVRGLIVGRNELAYWIRHNSAPDEEAEGRTGHQHSGGDSVETFTTLPPTIDNERECNRCFAQDGCMLYRRAVDRVVEDPENPSEIAGLYDRITSHLTPEQAAFYAHWERMLSLEEEDMVKFKRELWTLTAAAREELGRCFANMTIDVRQTDIGAGTASGQTHAHTYRFKRRGVETHSSDELSGGSLSPGDPVIVSIEPNTLSVAQGYVIEMTSRYVVVGLDHHLDAVLERTAVEKGLSLNSNSLDITFRLDKDEFSDGMAKIRFQLSRFFFSTLPRDMRHRELIVDFAPPRFSEDRLKLLPALPAHLNEDQCNAMRKAVTADDYALIVGMPGTGKTTTIAELIRLLVAQNKTILLASYTHSAVDTILRKLRGVEGVRMLRMGNPDRVHADLQHCTLQKSTNVEDLAAMLSAPNVIATTCLSTGHAIFAQRKFDYCIVDEASQITLPSCLGPLRFADRFILVGDHHQLPPLVRNHRAKEGGLDVSLFKRLGDVHPEAVVYLTRQYRMNESIMQISNHLFYHGQLKCGNERVAKQVLALPHKSSALDELHADEANSCSRDVCWLADLVHERRQAVFVDTDDVPGYESRHGRMVQNEVEAGIVQQVATALVMSGVKPREIAVITPYRQQIKLLQHLLLMPRSLSQEDRALAAAGGGQDVKPRRTAAHLRREAANRLGASQDIEVLTADRSQGRDKAVVLLSLVRSGKHGVGELLTDWRRINVALTRAQRKVVIIGSRRTLSAMDMLGEFFSLMEENKWIMKLPKAALSFHPLAQRPPGEAIISSPARLPLSQTKSSPSSSPLESKTNLKASSQSNLSSQRVLNGSQPLSQSSNGANVKQEDESSDDDDIIEVAPSTDALLGKRKERPTPSPPSAVASGKRSLPASSGTSFSSSSRKRITPQPRLDMLEGRSVWKEALSASQES